MGLGVGIGLAFIYGGNVLGRVDVFLAPRVIATVEGRIGEACYYDCQTWRGGNLSLSILLRDTFFVRAGAGVRSVNGDHSPLDTGETAHEKFRTVDVSLGLGNRWDWRTSFVSLDWVGFDVPASSSSSTDDPRVRLGGAPWEIRSSVTFGVAF